MSFGGGALGPQEMTLFLHLRRQSMRKPELCLWRGFCTRESQDNQDVSICDGSNLPVFELHCVCTSYSSCFCARFLSLDIVCRVRPKSDSPLLAPCPGGGGSAVWLCLSDPCCALGAGCRQRLHHLLSPPAPQKAPCCQLLVTFSMKPTLCWEIPSFLSLGGGSLL